MNTHNSRSIGDRERARDDREEKEGPLQNKNTG
jgi:hypothetical protein